MAYGTNERQMHSNFWWKKFEGHRPHGNSRHTWEDNITVDLKQVWRMWPGFIWLRIETNDGLSLTR